MSSQMTQHEFLLYPVNKNTFGTKYHLQMLENPS